MSRSILELTLPPSVYIGNPFLGVKQAGREAKLPPPFSTEAGNTCVSVFSQPPYAKYHESDLHLTVYISDHCFLFAQEDAFSFSPCIQLGLTCRNGDMDEILCVPAGLKPLLRATRISVGEGSINCL